MNVMKISVGKGCFVWGLQGVLDVLAFTRTNMAVITVYHSQNIINPLATLLHMGSRVYFA